MAKKYPKDAHLLPLMERNYICFPDWMRHKDWLWSIGAWIGERFFNGRYCFTVDRNKEGNDY